MDCFLSASDHRCKSSFTVVALVLVLYQLSLLLIGSVVGFFKESLQEVVYSQLGNTVLPWLGCLLLLDEIGDVLCLPFVEVLFFAVEEVIRFWMVVICSPLRKEMSSLSGFRAIILLAHTPSQLRLEVTSQNLPFLLAAWQDQAGPEVLPASVCLTLLIQSG